MDVFLVFMALCLAQADTIVLDNGAIRVEVDPALFVVRYVGPPGGPNFVTPLFVDQSMRQGTAWVDAGGIHTDLLPRDNQDAALRRGPATVIEERAGYVALLGAISTSGIRLKKEIRLDRTAGRAWYRVTALSVSGVPKEVAIRSTVRTPLGSTLGAVSEDDTLRPLAGLATLEPALAKAKPLWRIPVPPKSPLDDVILGALIPEIAHENHWGTWFRRIAGPFDKEGVFLQEASFLCRLDDGTQSFSSILQGPMGKLDASSPVVFEEEWRLEKRRQ